ncbi:MULTISPECIES: RNA polymerase sigma factor [Brucella]|uniref:RNA polymerase, sigma-24 subunit, ECF subfamily n=1 Tax=Brucella anthropi (strain ATCC 49188 / DSM 6882 / CCUG 24695 / JCM 21032 / LMG 3331 / NBRC 15819 / NCTC 12168 / Alc 37) TaxID=439375 RepID=A6X2M9_BRUA4|nr:MULTISPECIES: sigma-70 family RNA polymerase sigma factor [Brucella]ABS15483.1 RNA polymerase, sigma-24 subunit, ECF subfamily [Brucella anthropi ATCC 49188]AIK41372.1 RNA polymerase sigma factor, sigma-70 family protein [Brucella anthropi]KAB2729919.1 sigma-70 family RNA polymerase sigma factor [Brucella anthropi]KAB2746623.1 sigma-70 family RNA polymerase sigma factor [Brucella anthropi]KAB2749253.1 sigma-70 family RNA polymerase sigma factor [Brucella anthropi]
MTSRLWDLAELYESEQISLRAFVRRIVGNTATAEDVVQQAFLNLLSRYEDTAQAPGPAYVKRTARNLALNHLRDARRRADVEIEVDEPERFADARPSPEMTVLYRSELHRLLHSVAQLPPRRREAFVLNRIEGLSYDEVAERMGISRNTVITQIVSALAELDWRLSE